MCNKSVFCQIIPPFLSDKEVRELDSKFRERREIKSELEAMAAVASIGVKKTRRFIYDCKNTTFQQLKLARKEGGAKVKDKDINTAYDYAGVIRGYFKKNLKFNSFDNQGSAMIFNVHYGENYNNAFWDGDEMTFGDGDGSSFLSFVNSLDVMGHELGHGVIQFTANLDYEKQPGALNEHFADVFGTAIKQKALKQTAEKADWLIGNTIVGPSFPGKAIRSMKEPGTAFDGDPQPGHMDDFYKGSDDHFGVHINSGIPNRVFYLASREITTQKATRIWFDALQLLKYNSDFKVFKRSVLDSAKKAEKSKYIAKGSVLKIEGAFKTVGL
jgi:Zn-dependent metalloprotease